MTLAEALQKAVYTRLSSAAALDAAKPPVFDYVPENQPAPFIAIRSITLTDADILAEPYTTASVEIEAYSSYRGQRELHRFNALVRAQFHDVLFDLDEGAVVQCRVATSVTDVESDGKTHVSTTYIRLLLEH